MPSDHNTLFNDNDSNHDSAAAALVTMTSRRVPLVKDGSLPGEYQVVGFHFHWGENDTVGSEHELDGHRSAEVIDRHRDSWRDRFLAMSEPALVTVGVTYEILHEAGAN